MSEQKALTDDERSEGTEGPYYELTAKGHALGRYMREHGCAYNEALAASDAGLVEMVPGDDMGVMCDEIPRDLPDGTYRAAMGCFIHKGQTHPWLVLAAPKLPEGEDEEVCLCTVPRETPHGTVIITVCHGVPEWLGKRARVVRLATDEEKAAMEAASGEESRSDD